MAEPEAERFEEHYFHCAVCLNYLQTLQAAGKALARLPAAAFEEPAKPKSFLGWPAMTWAMAAAAGILLFAAVFFSRSFLTGPTPVQVARAVPAPAPEAKPSAQPLSPPTPRIKASQLADLSLPAFVAPNLREAGEDRQFEAGMKAYRQGDCRDALAELAKVPAHSNDGRAAEFYGAACEMRLGDLKAAAAGMHRVETAGDSPQQESALFYEAQIALASNNPAAAHRYLLETIALQGDLERRARDEDRKVRDLANEQADESAEKPDSVAK
ncbi:MAG: hypothetical protein WBE76_07430 [Terracidiphilus sp.]